MTQLNRPGRAHGARRVSRLGVAGAFAAFAAMAACDTDKLLKVSDTDVVSPASLVGKSVLPSALAAAIGDFAVAYAGSGGSEGQAQITGLMVDELFNAESFPTRIEVDQRNTNPVNGTMLTIFRDIARARATTDAVSERFKEFDATNRSYAEVLALAGFARVLLAENYCSGVPLSSANADGSFTYGAPQTTTQLLTEAVAKFDAAIAIATAGGASASSQLNLARLGRGRALLNLGRYADAAAAVTAVPSNFRYVIFHSENSGRQNNGINAFAQLGRRFAIPNREGVNGLPFQSLSDPRAPAFRIGIGFDAITPLIVTSKYATRSSSTPLAEGSEARLIEAEAALQTGNTVLYLQKLNDARASAVTYPATAAGGAAAPSPAPIADAPTTRDAQVDLLFQERGYTMFLTSHRLGDLRRLVRQYGRGQATVFPVGPYFKGGVYENDVNLPVPFEERNNPEFKGCLDRNA